ncbi:MAG: phosphatase PAP2 family protein [Mameliella sp.]|nr:phosphatase PAP2 family protein [Phaeodactylibacter sp.]
MSPLHKFWRSNRPFFSGMLQFVLFGALLLVLMETGAFVWFFSRHRSPLLDLLFVYGTKLGEPVAFVAMLILLLFVKFRNALAIPLLGLSVSIISYLTKSFFAHDRPFAYFEKLGIAEQLNLVTGVKVHTGATSFPSGHTMAGFALFAFVAFCWPRKKGSGMLLFTLALIVGLSRIYLVQHFFKDVYLGAILGVLIAGGWYYLQQLPKAAWLDRKLYKK